MTTETTTHQTKSAAWRPKHGQWFNAILKRHGRCHPAGPFKASGYSGRDSSEYRSRFVEGKDADGDTWVFCLRQFRLEPSNGRTC